ncbi:hypothetical protein BFC19_01195 [Brochothrix thermosphacta]|uniref:DUF2087 domain-containing protein n=1 Tax=Brochothrix thermosphacta TaxID=2756 RepID=UPI000E754B9F|nr:DUF2087 domain-containing protein [Brochothrix thermosphacta]ANZ94143.1 hypothetical protein BFC19_01195 [Brochothrix thermosphacta]ANZ97560.1 hypothetical protein BFC20_07580 [Brochothrix thermosphacta]
MDYSEEQKEVLERHVKNNKITSLPRKLKKKVVLLEVIANDFSMNKSYTEKEVNTILYNWYDDFVILRRYLVDYHFLKREDDGSLYYKLDK